MRTQPTHASERERAACPLYTAIAVIDGRWKPMLFQRLTDQPRGFGELHRMVPGVTKKVLREQLRQMQADDLVQRQPSPASTAVRYTLTPYGRTLGPVSKRYGAGAPHTSLATLRREARWSLHRIAEHKADSSLQ